MFIYSDKIWVSLLERRAITAVESMAWTTGGEDWKGTNDFGGNCFPFPPLLWICERANHVSFGCKKKKGQLNELISLDRKTRWIQAGSRGNSLWQPKLLVNVPLPMHFLCSACVTLQDLGPILESPSTLCPLKATCKFFFSFLLEIKNRWADEALKLRMFAFTPFRSALQKFFSKLFFNVMGGPWEGRKDAWVGQLLILSSPLGD